MATRSAAGASSAARKTFFEQQRELLLGEIAMEKSFEQVLANINKLNRSLEAVVTVGNEFSAVEALWSQFEGVMAKDEEPVAEGGEHEHEGEQQQQQQPQEEQHEIDQQGHGGAEAGDNSRDEMDLEY